ncbi:MAG: hypothetical protein ACE5GL_00555 [Calditrichia bacterium]
MTINNSQLFTTTLPLKIFGIDFSGAKNCALYIYICGMRITRKRWEVEFCRSAADLFYPLEGRQACLKALVDFIAG